MRKSSSSIRLDGDRLGMVSATFFATVVMGLGFFYSQITSLEVLFRTVVTFALTYVGTFVFVQILAATAAPELEALKKRERAERQALTKRKAAEAEAASETGEPE